MSETRGPKLRVRGNGRDGVFPADELRGSAADEGVVPVAARVGGVEMKGNLSPRRIAWMVSILVAVCGGGAGVHSVMNSRGDTPSSQQPAATSTRDDARMRSIEERIGKLDEKLDSKLEERDKDDRVFRQSVERFIGSTERSLENMRETLNRIDQRTSRGDR